MVDLTEAYLHRVADVWREQGVSLSQGLTDDELQVVEHTYQFQFPSDLRTLLQFVMPNGSGFPDWRQPNAASLQTQMSWPLEGMLFDIEVNTFWFSEWGTKPEVLEVAKDLAARKIAKLPRLILIFGHRYIPSKPLEAGNPVFSIYQTDIIYYGIDLPDYLNAEFSVPNPFLRPETFRQIAFWEQLVE